MNLSQSLLFVFDTAKNMSSNDDIKRVVIDNVLDILDVPCQHLVNGKVGMLLDHLVLLLLQMCIQFKCRDNRSIWIIREAASSPRADFQDLQVASSRFRSILFFFEGCKQLPSDSFLSLLQYETEANAKRGCIISIANERIVVRDEDYWREQYSHKQSKEDDNGIGQN